jgi:hypothetical protein
MAVTRRGGAFALALALLLGGGAGACTSKSGTGIVGPPKSIGDAAIYQECDSVCVRPGDCAMIYNDDGICPPGFLCALRFTCTPD